MRQGEVGDARAELRRWQWGVRVPAMAGLMLLVGSGGSAQTLARPGWAGSGLKVTQWWRNAVIFEVSPPSAAGAPAALDGLLAKMDDLQVLGADAVLLRGLSPMPGHGTASAVPLAAGYGSMDQFDKVMEEASRRRIRLLVEAPAGLSGDALASIARFWLSRGVSGIYVSSGSGGDSAARRATVRAVMHGYVGERVLVGDADAAGSASPADLTLRSLDGFTGSQTVDVGALRLSIQGARKAGQEESVEQIPPEAPGVAGDAAKARVSALMMVPGGVAMRLEDAGEGPEAQAKAQEKEQDSKDAEMLARATSPAGVSNAKRAIAARKAVQPPVFKGDAVFQWTQRMIGLHRGNPAMLLGEQSLPDFSGQGVMVSVWRGRSGPVLAEFINFRSGPVQVSAKKEFMSMQQHGSFLRPEARTDGGMGAMPLERVKLGGYGVFLGELGR